MYTIVMNSDKSLSCTSKATLYQGEKLVDKLKFLLPQTYEEHTLSEFTVVITFLNVGNVMSSETLVLSDPNYKGSMLCYYVSVDSELTRFAGDIKLHLTFFKGDQQILHSGDTIINIVPTEPCFQTPSGGSGEAITSDKMLDIMTEAGLTTPIANADNSVLMTDDDKILIL